MHMYCKTIVYIFFVNLFFCKKKREKIKKVPFKISNTSYLFRLVFTSVHSSATFIQTDVSSSFSELSFSIVQEF